MACPPQMEPRPQKVAWGCPVPSAPCPQPLSPAWEGAECPFLRLRSRRLAVLPGPLPLFPGRGFCRPWRWGRGPAEVGADGAQVSGGRCCGRGRVSPGSGVPAALPAHRRGPEVQKCQATSSFGAPLSCLVLALVLISVLQQERRGTARRRATGRSGPWLELGLWCCVVGRAGPRPQLGSGGWALTCGVLQARGSWGAGEGRVAGSWLPPAPQQHAPPPTLDAGLWMCWNVPGPSDRALSPSPDLGN